MTQKELKKQEAKTALLQHYIKKQVPKIIIQIKSVAKSGMSRRMKVYNQDMYNITGYIADLCDLSQNDDGLLIKGCGMDITFWLADYITKQLWETGKAPDWADGNGSMSCLKWQTI